MTDDVDKKTCGMCCMDIPTKARKCPYCQHFQNKWTMLMYHPAFMALFALIPFAALVSLPLMMYQQVLSPGEDFHKHAGEITVSDTRLEFGESEKGPTVAVVGWAQNDGDVSWKQTLLQVEFRDADGKLVDAGQDCVFFLQLPAHDKVAFKTSFHREFPQASYASFSIRVIAAIDTRAHMF